MAFLLKAIGLGGSTIPNFPYDLGDTEGKLAESRTIPWTMRSGTRQDDGLPVTIFELSLLTCGEGVKELARNVIKRAKTLMIPGFLRCFDAVEHKDTAYLATELCVPLQRILRDADLKREYYETEARYLEAAALGLQQVGTALMALHKNNLIHGNVSLDSTFVVRSGEWRIGGIEFVSLFNEPHSIYQRYWSMLPDYRRPPETLATSTSATSPFVHNVDAWGIGALIFAAVSGTPQNELLNAKTTEMRSARSMPRPLHSGFVGVTSPNPKMRMSIEKFLSDTEFITESEYVKCYHMVEELQLKDQADRDTVYRHLTQHIDLFPLRACKYLFLVKLGQAVQYGASSATALEPILKIGQRLSNDPDGFNELVAPIVMTMFTSNDPMVRARLLSCAQQYAPMLPQTLVNDKIWPHYVTGFNSTNANMRELTTRALVHFAPHLSEKIFAQEVIRYLTQMQSDREGPIRTNATICLCLISSYIPESIRAKSLLHGFGRMLKDPFLPSRAAALRSLSTSLKYFTDNQCCEMILPAVSPLMMDPYAEIRDLALKISDAIVARMHEYHLKAPADPQPEPKESPASASASAAYAAATPTTPAVQKSFWSWGSSSSIVDEPRHDSRSASSSPPVVTQGSNNTSVATNRIDEAKPTTAEVWAAEDDEDDFFGDQKTQPPNPKGTAPTTTTKATSAGCTKLEGNAGAMKLTKKRGLNATKYE